MQTALQLSPSHEVAAKNMAWVKLCTHGYVMGDPSHCGLGADATLLGRQDAWNETVKPLLKLAAEVGCPGARFCLI